MNIGHPLAPCEYSKYVERNGDELVPQYERWNGYLYVKMEGVLIEHTPKGTLRNDDFTFEKDRDIGASLINIDAYLRSTWAENFPREYQLDEDRSFTPDYGERVELTIDASVKEIHLAAVQRASEDNDHPLHVLGNWVYLAERGDHLNPTVGSTFRAAFEEAVDAYEETEGYELPPKVDREGPL